MLRAFKTADTATATELFEPIARITGVLLIDRVGNSIQITSITKWVTS